MPHYINPAEFILGLVNTDFAKDSADAEQCLDRIQNAWQESPLAARVHSKIDKHVGSMEYAYDVHPGPNALTIPLMLFHRNFIKSHRDIIAYTIRIVMYLALGIMMGTVWLRLSPGQNHIQSCINAIFFGGAFMSFMAVAYIPAFIEDLSAFREERLNDLYGPTSFMIANFVTGAPYLFLRSFLFSVVAYFLSNFRMDGTSFMRWVFYLFLDLMAAEGLVVLVSSIAPIFVVALAVTAFANGLWMCVNGFMVQVETLNVFYRYVFHYIDYQAYVFQLMMVNEFQHRKYECQKLASGESYCMYPPKHT
jgi:ABC-type multidrug transport system permease subunit